MKTGRVNRVSAKGKPSDPTVHEIPEDTPQIVVTFKSNGSADIEIWNIAYCSAVQLFAVAALLHREAMKQLALVEMQAAQKDPRSKLALPNNARPSLDLVQ
jgi:hypothetical protein